MAICVNCWADAQIMAISQRRSVTECYLELLESRKDNPCIVKELELYTADYPDCMELIDKIDKVLGINWPKENL